VSGVSSYYLLIWLILLENPVSEGNPTKKETPEVVTLQEFKLGSGGGFEPPTFGVMSLLSTLTRGNTRHLQI